VKLTVLGVPIRWLISTFLAGVALPIFGASRCPGNVASVPLHLVKGYLFIVPVSIDGAGPYDFLLDTGTRTTAIDRSLAGELHLTLQGAPVVEGITFRANASSARLDQLAAGSHAVANQNVLVYEFPAASVLPVRGILGEDYLQHFAMLLDNVHTLLCLDDSNAMRTSVKGPHIPLVAFGQAADGDTYSSPLIIEAHLSHQSQPVRLLLDTGANVCFLFKPSEHLLRSLDRGKPLDGIGGNASQTSYLEVPVQDMTIAALRLQNVSFFTPAVAQKNLQVTEFDGLVTTWLFRRVFIDHVGHFVVLEPW
jgi:hypothetical protein